VNRLTKCHEWNAAVSSTSGPGPDRLDKHAFKTSGEPLPGELMAFAMEDTVPFGIGRFLGMEPAQDGAGPWYNFEWYGNYNDKPDGIMRPGWIQPPAGTRKKAVTYYKEGPEHSTHQRMTNNSTDTWITKKGVVCSGFRLTKQGKVPPDVLRYITTDPSMKGRWTYPEAEAPLAKAGAMA